MSLPPTPEWMTLAKCRTLNSFQADDLFFNEAHGPGPGNRARRFCQGKESRTDTPCPVQAECLQLALDNDDRFGVWGGMSERQRRELHRTVARDKRNARESDGG